VEKFGGSPGILDFNILMSALERPKSGYYDSFEEEGASLFQSLWLNHGFLDGNKRLAFAALDVFMRLNGLTIKGHEDSVSEKFAQLTVIDVKNFSYLTSLIRITYL
jgi:death-on-curing protein